MTENKPKVVEISSDWTMETHPPLPPPLQKKKKEKSIFSHDKI